MPARNFSLQPFSRTMLQYSDTEPVADTIICNGSALVNTLPPRTAQTFEDYALLDVLVTILAYSSNYDRTDIVFDVYRNKVKARTWSQTQSEWKW